MKTKFNLVGYVEARQVTHATASEVAGWCTALDKESGTYRIGLPSWGGFVGEGGEIVTPERFGGITLYQGDPPAERIETAHPGDWIIKTNTGHLLIVPNDAFRDMVMEIPETGFERWRIEAGREAARKFLQDLTKWRDQTGSGALVISSSAVAHRSSCATITRMVDDYEREAEGILSGDQETADAWSGGGQPRLAFQFVSSELLHWAVERGHVKRTCKICMPEDGQGRNR